MSLGDMQKMTMVLTMVTPWFDHGKHGKEGKTNSIYDAILLCRARAFLDILINLTMYNIS